jgi:hypothetical protein
VSAAPYRLVIIGCDAAWADDLRGRVTEALADVVRLPGSVEFTRAMPEEDDPAALRPHTVVAFLADERSRDDPASIAALESARAQMLPVLPLTHAGVDIDAILPPVVRPLNARAWDGEEDAAVRVLLRLMGLIEQERRLFLSYRRQETTALALQLRSRLGERGYDVFLDRFSVPPAADFQRRINIELSDKAFVLLLESPAAVGSAWVQHEVAFALSHGISLLALSLPETRRQDQFPEVDEAFRHRLHERDLVDGALGDAALAAVLDEIESRYARQLRLRRVEMLGSVALWLQAAGVAFDHTPDEWGLAADWPATRGTVFLVTPRAPAPRDLRRLDDLRERREAESGRAVEGCLVYASAVQDEDDEALLRWIVDRRPLNTRLHERVPRLLGIG